MEDQDISTVEEEAGDMLQWMFREIQGERDYYQNMYYQSMDEKFKESRRRTLLFALYGLTAYLIIMCLAIWIGHLRHQGNDNANCYPNGTCNAELVCSKENICE
jgi:hypothetical protein